MRRSLLRLVTIVAAGLLAVGCVPANPACGEPSVSLAATVSDSAIEPSALAVCRDQEVVLELTSETDGVFHIHGYDDQAPAISLEPGKVRTIEFTADQAGQFIIELHAQEGGDSTEIGVLTVNEP